LIDYGRSLLRVAAISFGLAAIYGAIYRIFPHVLDYKDSANTWFTPYYFSIVTYTTLGFGDVRPATLAGEIIVSSEVVLGYTTLGLLLPSSRKASRAAAEHPQNSGCMACFATRASARSSA
jgi:voltage-gated potassium channel Kch